MERSVQLIVAGGLALVVGLWLLETGSLLGDWRYAGLPVVAVGVAALAAGIGRDLTPGPIGT